ncbi:unnamed protein product, partial [marine sediment metagenome]
FSTPTLIAPKRNEDLDMLSKSKFLLVALIFLVLTFLSL